MLCAKAGIVNWDLSLGTYELNGDMSGDTLNVTGYYSLYPEAVYIQSSGKLGTLSGNFGMNSSTSNDVQDVVTISGVVNSITANISIAVACKSNAIYCSSASELDSILGTIFSKSIEKNAIGITLMSEHSLSVSGAITAETVSNSTSAYAIYSNYSYNSMNLSLDDAVIKASALNFVNAFSIYNGNYGSSTNISGTAELWGKIYSGGAINILSETNITVNYIGVFNNDDTFYVIEGASIDKMVGSIVGVKLWVSESEMFTGLYSADWDENGLKVKIGQIPEPSTCVAIFAIAALTFTLHRRKIQKTN